MAALMIFVPFKLLKQLNINYFKDHLQNVLIHSASQQPCRLTLLTPARFFSFHSKKFESEQVLAFPRVNWLIGDGEVGSDYVPCFQL